MAGLLSRRARTTDERGVALVTAMVITLTVFAIGGIWTALATHQYSASARERHRQQALNAAEAGVNQAMSGLSADAGYTTTALVTLPGGTGEYEVSVSTPSSAAPTRRSIASTGYAPSRAAPQRVARRVEQQVDLISTSAFRFALFTAPGGVAGANNMTVNGDVYSAGNLALTNRATVSGSIISLGSVTTVGNSTIGGDIRAAGNVTISNATTTVLGNVYSGGNVVVTGRVRGNVQAAGTITGTGTVDGSRAQYSPPPAVQTQTLPTFTWNALNYSSSQEWASPEEFRVYWFDNKAAFSGHHRVLCQTSCVPLVLDDKWTMTGDVTIASDSPVTMSREVGNAGDAALTLTVASFSAASPAVLMSNNISPPDSIKIALFAPNGPVSFQNRKDFSGAVYTRSMSLAQQFTLTFVPVTVKGFTWDVASSNHFVIQAGVFREVPAP